MKYSHFETLAFVLGALAIVASVFLAPSVAPQAPEVAAQLLVILVLAGALHWGRNGGFLAALLAIAVYVAMRYPLLQSQGLSSDLLAMLGARAAMYAGTGIIGGEVASRVKYLFARFENEALVDPLTGAYSARYAAEAIQSGLGQWERYQTEYSVISMAIDPATSAAMKHSRLQQLAKQATAMIRNDIRMVDDLAYAPPRTFLVLLPRTPLAGARVVAERLSPALSGLLGISGESLAVSVLSAAASADGLRRLADTLAPAPDAPATPMPDRRGAPAESAQEPVA